MQPNIEKQAEDLDFSEALTDFQEFIGIEATG